MGQKENYERITILNINETTKKFVYEIKNYLDDIFEKNKVQFFYMKLDGLESTTFDNLEYYEDIMILIAYHPMSNEYGREFYKKNSLGLSCDQFQLFGLEKDKEGIVFYTYNGTSVTDLNYKKTELNFDDFDIYSTENFMMMIDLPEEELLDDFDLLLKEWTSYGDEFFQECANIELIDGNISYYIEESFHLSEKEFKEVIFIYEQLIKKAVRLNGELVNSNALWHIHSKEKDVVLKICKEDYEAFSTFDKTLN